MGRKQKYSTEQKIWAAETYLKGLKSAAEIAVILKMGPYGRIQYVNGVDNTKLAQLNCSKISLTIIHTLLSLKRRFAKKISEGKGSSSELATRYGISSHTVVSEWVKKYTGTKNELKAYDPQRVVYMAARKKTTLEERTRIVQWYFDNGCSYKKTAAEFGCSYTQVRDWVIKFKDQGEIGLQDRRGKRKEASELSTLKQMEREIKRLQAMALQLQMENELLKKAEKAEMELWTALTGSDKSK